MSTTNRVYIISLLFGLIFLTGMIFPDSWWGVHFLAFVPSSVKTVIVLICGLLLVYPKIKPINFSPKGKLSYGMIIIVATTLAIIQHNLSIALDDYGDAFQYRAHLDQTITELPANFYTDLFSANLAPSGGRKTVTLFYTYLSYITGANYGSVFQWMATLFGFGFSVSWMLFLKHYIKQFKWQLILSAVGLFAPFTLIFYGHTETYAPTFFLFSSWLMGMLLVIKHQSKKWNWILLGGLILLLKIHPVTILLFPAWVLCTLSFSDKWKGYVTPKNAIYFVLIPVAIMGSILYFFVLEDYQDPRFLDNVKASERLFLPMVSPEAPLDRYNLLSANHIFDFFNIVLWWSIPILFLLAAVFILFRKRLKSNQPENIILTTTAILFAALLFMINPLVSMPMDWDLFSFPAPVLLILLAALIRQTEDLEWPVFSSTSTLALIVFTLPIFMVNAVPTLLSKRLESVGKHVYRTYYLHSNRIIITALQMDEDMNAYLSRKNDLLAELKSDALPGNDPMYANLLMDDGYFYLKHAKEYSKAASRLQEALYYNPNQPEIQQFLQEAQAMLAQSSINQPLQIDPNIEQDGLYLLRELKDFDKARAHFEHALANYPENPVYTLFLMESCFMQQDYQSAYYHAINLVKYQYPDEQKALRISIHCALEAQMYQEAEINSKLYLEKFPEDEIIDFVYHKLVLKEDLEELKLHFGK